MNKILFIEDETSLQKTITDFLATENYSVINAYEGEKGLALAEQEMPDLILLDLILPKKNGFEVLSALKANKKTKDIPVIVFTNLEGTKDVEKALSLGATTYLVKANYSLKDVIEKIKNSLAQQ